MNSNAANAFLKLLEEPPAKALIMLVSPRGRGACCRQSVRRCRVLTLPPLANGDVEALLGRYRPDLAGGGTAPPWCAWARARWGGRWSWKHAAVVELYGEVLAPTR